MTDARSVDILLVEDDGGDELITMEAFREVGDSRVHLHVVRDGVDCLNFLYREPRTMTPRAPPSSF